jgi:hypothetical protein
VTQSIGRPEPDRDKMVVVAHAVYLVATGIWPLVHRRSFERVTGPKTDFWLVRTVGGLAAATGLSLGCALAARRTTTETRVLALASASVFGIADVYAARKISRVYLGDLLLQPVFAAAWLRLR